MAATPGYEFDILEIISTRAELSAGDVVVSGGTRNAWPGPPRPKVGAGRVVQSVFCEHVAQITDHDNDDNNRHFVCDIVVVGGRSGDDAVRARAARIQNAIARINDAGPHGSMGRWTAPTSGASYIDLTVTDVRKEDGMPDDVVYWIITVDAWFNG